MHWRAPATMLASFMAGIALAIGHHFFYQSLHDTPVDNATFDQQINIGIGTAFTFLVRAFLVIAVGVAFVQVLWQRLLRQDITVARIDSMTQLLASLFDMFNLRTIWQQPLLGFLAFISWTLPFASIVPPATLSVQSSITPQSETASQNLPNLDFTKDNFVKTYSSARDPKYDEAPNNIVANYFGGSEDKLNQISMITALQAQIPQIQPPAQNSSFSLPFFGPAIQCLPTSSDVIKEFDSIFGCNFSLPDRSGSTPCGFDYTYLSWVPNYGQRVPLGADDGTLNFVNQYTASDYGLTTIGSYLGEPAMMYMGTKANNTWSMLNCSLYNASYTVKFDYRNGVQKLITTRNLLNSLPFINQISSTIEANITGWDPPGTIIAYTTINVVNYQGIMDSFGRIIVGGVLHAVSQYGGGTNVLATSVFSTGLQKAFGLGGRDPSITIAKMAEQLFENITMELFSDEDFVSVNASRFPATEVTLSTFPITYLYTWRRLVLAYGLAVLFATVSVTIGGFMFMTSGKSYSHTFSTILRTTRDRSLNNLVRQRDEGGQDPLPRNIAEGSVRVGATRPMDEEGESNDTERPYQPRHRKPSSIATYSAIRGYENEAGVPEPQGVRMPLGDLGANRDVRVVQVRRSVSSLSIRSNQRYDY